MTTATIKAEIQKLAPSSIIELYELDATNVGGTLLRFHSGTNELRENLVWQGYTYTRYPVQVTGFEMTSGGQLPRPKVAVSNLFGSITEILTNTTDLLGAKFTRKRTLLKFLDAVNFEGGVNPTADNTAEFSSDVFYIDRKTMENRDVVEFELAASIDLQGIQLPKRQVIQNVCPWLYRGSECGYSGTSYFKTDDTTTSDPTLDVCGKRLSSCKKRFGQYAELPFGGFAGAGLFK